MKIVCDACQAKYSISDDKVQGKVFKIRCKKCSNIIVVRGGAQAAEAPAPAQQEKDTRVYDYGYEGGQGGDESVWHVVINQDQVGPMTAAEVQQRFASGVIALPGYASVLSIALLGLANALMWPAIWPLAIDGLGRHTKTGSALLIMAIAGGALLPLLNSWLGEHPSIGHQHAYALMIPCYLFIGGYAISGHKQRSRVAG